MHHRTFGGGSRLGFLGRLGGLGFLACGAKGNLSDVFKRAPLDTWFSLSMDLYCFEKAGADLKRVDTGMLIATSGKLSLGITGVRMVPGMAGKAVIRCEAPRE